MRRNWTRWLAGGLLLCGVLALGIAWSLDRLELNRRRHWLGSLQFACKLYASDHNASFPPDLDALFPVYIDHPRLRAYAANDVEYFPGASEKSAASTVLLREKRPDARDRRWVAYVDMSLDIARPRSTPPGPS